MLQHSAASVPMAPRVPPRKQNPPGRRGNPVSLQVSGAFQIPENRRSPPGLAAHAGEIESDDALVRLPEVSETKSRLRGTVELIYLTTQAIDPIAVIGAHLGDLPPRAQRKNLAERARIKSEQHGFGIIHVAEHSDLRGEKQKSGDKGRARKQDHELSLRRGLWVKPRRDRFQQLRCCLPGMAGGKFAAQFDDGESGASLLKSWRGKSFHLGANQQQIKLADAQQQQSI